MQKTHLSYREWAIGLHLYTTTIKGISSMRLYRELGISQKSAWFLLQRLRTVAETGKAMFSGPVEADESFSGGKRRNTSNSKRKEMKGAGHGLVGKVAVVAVKERETNQVRAKLIESTAASSSANLAHGKNSRPVSSRNCRGAGRWRSGLG